MLSEGAPCTVCGRGCLWGSRHVKCAEAARRITGANDGLDGVLELRAELAASRAREQALREEVAILRASGCSDCGSTGHDGSNPCCSCHGTGSVEVAMLMTERDEARAEVERLRDAIRAARIDLDHLISRNDDNRASVADAISADVELRNALAREDGGE